VDWITGDRGKLIKDPVYGYIRLSDTAIDIINTDSFQRLRNIRQTSYAPLYPSSLHNRFVHSIGVYHLGCIASETLKRYAGDLDDIDQITETFITACLLHDVGHAPFSHIGEDFFDIPKDSQYYPSLRTILTDTVKDDCFAQESLKMPNKAAAPHECMSVIIALKYFSPYIADDYRSFFARCITGYHYLEVSSPREQILNCYISLLHSSLIDVDRLDYVIRDAFFSGFQSVSIDYERLLKGLVISGSLDDPDERKLAYHKSSLSIIEGAIYAHDAERKWIQNHPTILYENMLTIHTIRNVINFMENDFNEGSCLFSFNALSPAGCIFEFKASLGHGDLKYKKHIRLLADEDILHIAKNDLFDDPLIRELFSRDLRRHAIWKSESSYRALFEGALGRGAEILNMLEAAFVSVEKFLLTSGDDRSFPCINSEAIEKITTHLQYLEQETMSLGTRQFRHALHFVNSLQEYCRENNVEFNFMLVTARRFKSNFENDIDNILIFFPETNKAYKATNVSAFLKSDVILSKSSFFYLFHTRKTEDGISSKTIDPKSLALQLIGAAVKLMNAAV